MTSNSPMSVLRVLVFLPLLALAGGCSYVKPYVRVDIAEPTARTGKALPQLDVAVQKAEAWARDAERLRDETSTTRRSLDLLTFGLTTASGVSLLYKGHRDLTTGFAVGAATSYTGSALFLTPQFESIYTSARDALMCVSGRAKSLESAASAANASLLRDSAPNEGVCGADASVVAARSRYRRARESLGELSRSIAATDGSARNQVEEAALSVIRALDREIANRTLNPAAVMAAAKGITPLALGIAGAPTDPGFKAKADFPDRDKKCAPEDAARIAADYDKAAKTLAALEASLSGAVNALDTLKTACTLTAPAAQALAVSQTEITVAKDAQYTITISGGSPTYQVDWVGTRPAAKDLLVVPSPDRITLVGLPSMTTEATYTLLVKDSSLVPQEKKITVKTKP